MDTTIQSLVQSPYMRTMASIPSRTENFLHGIVDHMPPYSKQRVNLNPIRGSGTDTTWEFDIPRLGLLHSMQLYVRVKTGLRTTNANTPRRLAWDKARDTIMAFANSVVNIDLYSKNRFIERIVTEAIPYELSRTHSLEDLKVTNRSYHSNNGMVFEKTNEGQATAALPDGCENGIESAFLSEPVNGTPTNVDDFQNDRSADFVEFVIPVPSCSTTSLKKNFQTNFIESLSLQVTTRKLETHHLASSASYSSALDTYTVELVCDFHNFHPSVENVIRNANYEVGIPATIPYYDWLRFERRTLATADKVQYSLECDSLISEFIIVPRMIATGQPPLYGVDRNYYVTITSNSEVLYEMSFSEMLSHHGKSVILDEEVFYPSIPMDMQDIESRGYMPVRLNLRKTSDIFSGGFAFSSITNPVLTIYANEYVYRNPSHQLTHSALKFPTGFQTGNMEFSVVGKRHFLLRIDSDTGVISRTIES